MTRRESPLMTPGEVAALFNVDVKTVSRWDVEGKFPPGTVIRTLGNQRRFRRDVVTALWRGDDVPRSRDSAVATVEAIADGQVPQ